MTQHGRTTLSREMVLRELRENRALLERYAVKRIGLFGSYASDRARADSDLDFVVEFERPTYDNFMGLTDALETLFGRKVEILTPEALDSMRVPRIAKSIRETLVYG